jgi:hypothetical protein
MGTRWRQTHPLQRLSCERGDIRHLAHPLSAKVAPTRVKWCRSSGREVLARWGGVVGSGRCDYIGKATASAVSVDHDLRLRADYSPRLGRWTVVQREQFVI